MNNTHLQAAIAKRVFDILGIFSKDMVDIRNEFYSISENIWSGKLCLDEDDNSEVIFLYSEDNENKFMITKFTSNNVKSNWFSLVCMSEDEDPDLNKIYISTEIDKVLKFRDISYIELSNLLKCFELIRQHMPSWAQYSPLKEDLEVLNKFINSIGVDD